MRPFDTLKGGPLAATGSAARPTPPRASARAAFLSQLIAERYHLATQRQKRQAPVGVALQTYDAAGRISIRRLPPGYRMSVDA